MSPLAENLNKSDTAEGRGGEEEEEWGIPH